MNYPATPRLASVHYLDHPTDVAVEILQSSHQPSAAYSGIDTGCTRATNLPTVPAPARLPCTEHEALVNDPHNFPQWIRPTPYSSGRDDRLQAQSAARRNRVSTVICYLYDSVSAKTPLCWCQRGLSAGPTSLRLSRARSLSSAYGLVSAESPGRVAAHPVPVAQVRSVAPSSCNSVD
jgi:hypothetical protein